MVTLNFLLNLEMFILMVITVITDSSLYRVCSRAAGSVRPLPRAEAGRVVF